MLSEMKMKEEGLASGVTKKTKSGVLTTFTTKKLVSCGGFNMVVIKNRHNYPYIMTS